MTAQNRIIDNNYLTLKASLSFSNDSDEPGSAIHVTITAEGEFPYCIKNASAIYGQDVEALEEKTLHLGQLTATCFSAPDGDVNLLLKQSDIDSQEEYDGVASLIQFNDDWGGMAFKEEVFIGVGEAGFQEAPKGIAVITKILVDEKVRGCGIGSQLLNTFQSLAQAYSDITVVEAYPLQINSEIEGAFTTLSTNTADIAAIRRFYRRNHFFELDDPLSPHLFADSKNMACVQSDNPYLDKRKRASINKQITLKAERLGLIYALSAIDEDMELDSDGDYRCGEWRSDDKAVTDAFRYRLNLATAFLDPKLHRDNAKNGEMSLKSIALFRTHLQGKCECFFELSEEEQLKQVDAYIKEKLQEKTVDKRSEPAMTA